MNKIPYKSDPRAEQWVSDSIDVAKVMGVKVVLMAFFSNRDLKNDREGIKETIRKLKKVAPKGEDNGIILGIESWLDADEHMEILNGVDSPNVKVYYDVVNSNKMGYNIYEEIRSLGKENICEFHAKENGFLLGKGRVDFLEVRKTIDDFGFNPIETPVHVHDFQATVKHLMGIDHEQFTFKHQGRRYRLTDVHGNVVKDVLS